MTDMAILISAISTLAVAVGVLVVSVGIFILVSKLGSAIESMAGGNSDK